MTVLRRRRFAPKVDPTAVFSQFFLLPAASSMAQAAKLGPTITLTRASPGWYWNESKVLVSAATNLPRFDHDPATGAERGLLPEEERENLCLRSEEFDVDGSGNPWTHTRSSISADAIVALDGNTTADELIEDGTGSSTHLVEQSISFISGNAYTLTVFAKKNTRNNLRLTFATAAFPSGAYAVFNFDTGTVVSTGGGADSSSITDIGGGWYRASVTATADTTTSSSVQIYLHNGTSITYNGDGSSGLYIWGAQVEIGAFATSYIPTTTAAVIRSACVDSATITSLLGSANTLVISARTGYGAGVVVQLDDGTENNRYRIERNASNEMTLYVTNSSVEQVGASGLNLGTVADLTDFTLAIRLAANDFASSLDGAALVTDTSGSLPTVTTIRAGMDTSGDEWNSTIAKIALFNTGKPDDFLLAA